MVKQHRRRGIWVDVRRKEAPKPAETPPERGLEKKSEKSGKGRKRFYRSSNRKTQLSRRIGSKLRSAVCNPFRGRLGPERRLGFCSRKGTASGGGGVVKGGNLFNLHCKRKKGQKRGKKNRETPYDQGGKKASGGA